jgi:hypothetical protein
MAQVHALLGGAAAWPLAAGAQQPGRRQSEFSKPARSYREEMTRMNILTVNLLFSTLLSRMYVINAIGSDPDLARFYEIDWQIIPNLMMDLIVPLLHRVMNIFAAGQVYTTASFVLILSGTVALNRRLFGHWSILPLIAFPLLYNVVFLLGTMNYIFGIGLSLWVLASWMWLREQNLPLRLAVSMLFVLALFFCHLYAVGLYALGLLAFELHRLLLIYGRGARMEFTNFVGCRSLTPILSSSRLVCHSCRCCRC